MGREVDDAINKLDAIRDEVNGLRTKANDIADRLESGVDKALEALEEVNARLDAWEEDDDAQAIERVRAVLSRARKCTPSVSAFHNEIARALAGEEGT